MAFRSGPLRDVFEVHAPADAVDSGGAVVPADGLLGTRRGRVLEPRGTERAIADQMAGRHVSRVQMRYFAGLSVRHVLKKVDADFPGGRRVYQITGVVNPDGRKIEHLVDVVEAV